uniref:Uncharacterized protein n=1 Tax=Sphaerodactylus townsendi TaxID=933632 RepID=A0ACB8G9X6_9SAUR
MSKQLWQKFHLCPCYAQQQRLATLALFMWTGQQPQYKLAGSGGSQHTSCLGPEENNFCSSPHFFWGEAAREREGKVEGLGVDNMASGWAGEKEAGKEKL